MGKDVVVPIRIGRGAALRGDNHQTVAIPDVGEWMNAFLPTLCPNRMQKKQRSASEPAADLARVSPELINNRLVRVVCMHHLSLLRNRDEHWFTASYYEAKRGPCPEPGLV